MIPRESTWSSGRRRRDATSDRVERPRCSAQVNSFAKPQAALSPGNLAYHETKDEEHAQVSPLHDFEESVKGFVDFFVLFAFGAVNAGVDVRETGGFSFVVLLGLLIGFFMILGEHFQHK